jgi:hypothetical protein
MKKVIFTSMMVGKPYKKMEPIQNNEIGRFEI